MIKPSDHGEAMKNPADAFDWRYLIRPEDAAATPPSRLAGACKLFLWTGVSILAAVSLGHLG